ncbi:MAG: outer membrane protein assembly factor BamE [Betaproteobacteria bacterium]|nr:outer membrane protein assembly factor BamE [Betaproteobacteria bacterium]
MRVVILALMLAATGCRDVPLLPGVTPYKIDIQQGNVVTQDMVEKLQPGMTRAQVRFILGTPLVVDAFRTDRWDYVFLYKKGGGVTEQRRLIVFFKDDKLLRVDGDQMPPGPAARSAAGVVNPAAGAPAVAGDKPAAAKAEPAKDKAGAETGKKEPQPEEKGFFGRMLEKLGF